METAAEIEKQNKGYGVSFMMPDGKHEDLRKIPRIILDKSKPITLQVCKDETALADCLL